MRKFLFAILLFAPALAHAEKRFAIQASTNSAPMPQWKEFVSEAFYYSSNTCSGTGSTNLGISTGPALLHSVVVSSAGAGSPILIFFDSPASQVWGSASARQVTAPIDGGKTGTYTYNVATSSGLWLQSSGGTGFIPPCVSVNYTER